MGKAKLQVLRETTQTYLGSLDKDNPPSLHDIEQELLKQLEIAYLTECCMKPPKQHWKVPETLTQPVIADIIMHLCDVRRISCAGSNADPKHDLLAIYQNEGPDEGIYIEATDMVYKLTKGLNYAADEKFGKDVIHTLRTEAPRLIRNADPDLIAVNNGIFHYKNKKLMPFDPEIVFLAKSYVDYNPNTTSVKLINDDDGTEWEFDAWLHDLTEDQEITDLLWEVMSAMFCHCQPCHRAIILGYWRTYPPIFHNTLCRGCNHHDYQVYAPNSRMWTLQRCPLWVVSVEENFSFCENWYHFYLFPAKILTPINLAIVPEKEKLNPFNP